MLAATIARWLVAMPTAPSAYVTARGPVRQPGHQLHAMGMAPTASGVAVATVGGAADGPSIMLRHGGPAARYVFAGVPIASGFSCRPDGVVGSKASRANVGGIVAMQQAACLLLKPLHRLPVAA
jgi:hypothetical protein